MNKDIFTAICDRITDEVAAFNWVDWDSGQVDIVDDMRPAIAFPACLVDIAYPGCQNIAENIQIVTCNITLRLVFKDMGSTSHVSPVRDAALAVFETIEALHEALQGWGTDALSSLSRLSATAERRKDGLKVYRIVYQTTFQESV